MTKQSFVSFSSFSNHHCLFLFLYSRLLLHLFSHAEKNMEEKRRWIMPAFGNWEYLESGSQAGLIRASFFGEENLFALPVAMPAKSAYSYCVHCHRKVRDDDSGVGVGVEKNCSKEQRSRRKGSVDVVAADMRGARRAPMAVDEDLYKIPPELLLCTEPKRETMLRNLLWGCMGSLNCIR